MNNKKNESLYLDSDLMQIVKDNHKDWGYRSVSSFFETSVREKLRIQEDVFSKYNHVKFQREQAEEKEQEVIKEIEKLIEEGNKKEREQANKVLKEEEERNIKRQQEEFNTLIVLRQNNILEEFLNCSTDEDYQVFLKKHIALKLRYSILQRLKGYEDLSFFDKLITYEGEQ
jgi:hypothetical protein